MDAVRFIAAYSGFNIAQPSTSASGDVQIQGKDGIVTGLATVSRYIIGDKLKASTPELDAQLNDHLQSRTFLVGRSLTLADLVVFGVVQPATATFPAAQILHFANLLRWADHIQNLAGPIAASVFPKKLTLTKPRFVEPAPAPPPAPKAPVAAAAPAATPSKAGPPATTKADAPAPSKAKEAAAPEVKAPQAPPPPASVKKGEGKGEAKAEGGNKKGEAKAEGGGGKKGGGGDAKKEEEEPHIGLLDIRVGTIVKVDKHPNADSLYLEEIDLGEDKPRQVISGLVKFVPQEKMLGLRVMVVCNLKPAKMREVMSYGMVLCASNDSHDVVEPIVPPEGVPNGERITFEGFPGPPLDEVNPKKKILERLFPDMKTDSSGAPVYKGAAFMTSKGPITSPIPNAHVA